jgi:carbamoyltransferase
VALNCVANGKVLRDA